MDTPYQTDMVINDEGCLAYIMRNWLAKEIADELFEILKTDLPWVRYPTTVYGKTHPTPRLMCAFSDTGLEEHNYTSSSIPFQPWPISILEIKERLIREFNVHVDSALGNYYCLESDYIAFHSDREAMGLLHPVFGLTLGGTRDFDFRHKKDLSRKERRQLHSGDLLVMLGRTQELWTHGIPKRAHPPPRISLTFRQLQE